MYKKKKYKSFFVLPLILFFILVFYSNIKFSDIANISDNFYTNYSEIEDANKDNRFGNFITISLEKDELSTGVDNEEENSVIFKLFGIIPIKKVKVSVLPEDEVLAGGTPIGLSVKTSGVMVVSDTIINVSNNEIIKNKFLKTGDIIKKINNNEIEDLDDIDNILLNSNSDTVDVEIIRNNKDKNISVSLLKDSENKYKLGVWVKNDISGVGTLTFVREKDGAYGALGHAVTNGNSDTIVPIIEGNIYNCNLVGINKGSKNKPGELRAVFVQKDSKGDITQNTPYGIFGNLSNYNGLVDFNRSLKIGGRLSVKPGKAKIISSISGIQEEYEIEIIKANFQSKSSDKSIVFRVTDKRLLELTGGIVQGMSGSPIVQDDKLVGAVTHVFLSDSTKGYGVYSDWMLEQIS